MRHWRLWLMLLMPAAVVSGWHVPGARRLSARGPAVALPCRLESLWDELITGSSDEAGVAVFTPVDTSLMDAALQQAQAALDQGEVGKKLCCRKACTQSLLAGRATVVVSALTTAPSSLLRR
jgi:hypothetical protein